MKGLYYNRHDESDVKESWHQPAKGESIVLNSSFFKFFPKVEIQDGNNVEIIFDREGSFDITSTNKGQTHNIDQFSWGWSGYGANEHWFDDQAICLGNKEDYRSGSGLTAASTRTVAYKRHVEVESFRGDCKDETRMTPKPGKVWAEFVNGPGNYRANWTGFGIGTLDSSATPIIGDALDDIIKTMLSGQVGDPTVCRHNGKVQAHIVTTDPSKVSLFLCKSCRMSGVQWKDFIGRNRADTCPYFRRACKSVVEKSDPFPEWFSWAGSLV